MRSSSAASLLKQKGFDDVANVGSFDDWTAAGLPASDPPATHIARRSHEGTDRILRW
jgi:hypothetical protein